MIAPSVLNVGVSGKGKSDSGSFNGFIPSDKDLSKFGLWKNKHS